MPRYVFEVSVTLGAGYEWTPAMCRLVAEQQREWFVEMMKEQQGPYEIEASEPFELA